jgi:hypothetical protein
MEALVGYDLPVKFLEVDEVGQGLQPATVLAFHLNADNANCDNCAAGARKASVQQQAC